jgi:hypothetical protein
MLAVDSQMYNVPVRTSSGWCLVSKGESQDVIHVDRFRWTLAEGDKLTTSRGDEIEGRATFEYNSTSVKPSPRTLRVFGAEKLRGVISYLASRKETPKVENTAQVETNDEHVQRLLLEAKINEAARRRDMTNRIDEQFRISREIKDLLSLYQETFGREYNLKI